MSAILFLPAILFAKGAIIGYAGGWQASPTAAQLDRVTHIVLMEWSPNPDGTLRNLYPGSAQVGGWLTRFVNDAHAKGVKVSFAITGSKWRTDDYHFPHVTRDEHRANFVKNIVDFVHRHNLDGVDIDWEFPTGDAEWKQCMSLLEELRAAMPNKRITIAIGADSPQPQFNNHFNMTDRSIVQERIWEPVDAIHLMTYGMHGVTRPVRWETHSDVHASKATLNRWADFGKGQPGFCKEKLIMGCAFYGLATPSSAGFYRNGGGVGCDTPETLKQKVDFCWDHGFGGVMIWELGYDKNLSTTPDLLTAIWEATEAKRNQTSIHQSNVFEIQVYPNPFVSEITISDAANSSLQIVDLLGKVVYTQQIDQAVETIQLGDLASGVYFLRIEKDGKTVVSQVIKR